MSQHFLFIFNLIIDKQDVAFHISICIILHVCPWMSSLVAWLHKCSQVGILKEGTGLTKEEAPQWNRFQENLIM